MALLSDQPAPTANGRPRADPEQLPTPLRSRALRVAMQTTLLAPLAAAASFVLASRGGTRFGSYAPLFITLALAAVVATLLPWDRLFRTVWGMRILYGWSAVNIMLIALGIWATGGAESNLLFLFALTTVFFAVVFPPRAQAAFLIMTLACYAVVLGLSTWDPLPLIVLATLGFLANYLSRELRRQMAAHQEARVEAERRWALVSMVSAAARDMATTDSRRVLQAVVDSIASLGFDSARIYMRRGRNRYVVVLPDGVSEDFVDGIRSLPDEVRTKVLDRGRQIVLSAAETDIETTQTLRAIGLESLVAKPILVGDRARAVLVVGSSDPERFTPRDVAIFEMLAAQASIALDNARRFEDQRRMVDRLSELDRLKGDFLSNMSHELRTPLTVIKGMGRTLEQQWETVDDELRRDLLARLNANSEVLDSIIGDLLDYSRLEAGRLEPRIEEVDLGAIVANVTARLDALYHDHDLRIDTEEGLIAEADPVLIERVVENLLSNAAKYTPSGSWVHVAAYRDGDQKIVAVTDGGPGIPKQELRHLGERFFRGGDPHTRTARGTGLGLAVVSEILELHGTELEIHSELGVGSRFSFRLPGEVKTAAKGGTKTRDHLLPPDQVPQQLSFDDLLLSPLAASVTPLEIEQEQDQSRASRLGAAAVATVVTAASSFAVTGMLPQPAEELASGVLSSIGFSGSESGLMRAAEIPREAPQEDDATEPREPRVKRERPRDRTEGSGSTSGSTGGSGSTSGGGGTGGGGGGTGGGGGGTGGGGGGTGGGGGPGNSGDAPGKTGDSGKSGDAPGQNKDKPKKDKKGPKSPRSTKR